MIISWNKITVELNKDDLEVWKDSEEISGKVIKEFISSHLLERGLKFEVEVTVKGPDKEQLAVWKMRC